jgi:hypothetical protein
LLLPVVGLPLLLRHLEHAEAQYLVLEALVHAMFPHFPTMSYYRYYQSHAAA